MLCRLSLLPDFQELLAEHQVNDLLNRPSSARGSVSTTTTITTPCVPDRNSEQLPCFDPTICIKHLFINRENALRICPTWRQGQTSAEASLRGWTSASLCRSDCTCSGGRGPRGGLGGPPGTSDSHSDPGVPLQVRQGAGAPSEFHFLASAATISVACAFAYIRDPRALVLPIVWVDFISLMLAETFFSVSKTVFLIAIASGLYLMAIITKILLQGPVKHDAIASSHVEALTFKDALVNSICLPLSFEQSEPMRCFLDD